MQVRKLLEFLFEVQKQSTRPGTCFIGLVFPLWPHRRPARLQDSESWPKKIISVLLPRPRVGGQDSLVCLVWLVGLLVCDGLLWLMVSWVLIPPFWHGSKHVVSFAGTYALAACWLCSQKHICKTCNLNLEPRAPGHNKGDSIHQKHDLRYKECPQPLNIFVSKP